jgi:hypothetical protein
MNIQNYSVSCLLTPVFPISYSKNQVNISCLPITFNKLYSLQPGVKKLIFEPENPFAIYGAVAQTGERIPRTDEAVGSTPICSTS